ncbi:MAG: rhodanese-like domain-containing protein [Gammaproteobacteria bacterium]|jgi:rhodanese-related sulfurtransferase
MPVNRFITLLSAFLVAGPGAADEAKLRVNITPDIADVEVMHNGEKLAIMRRQDAASTVNPAYAKTARDCPPFCIQPIVIAPGVETIGELELLDYLARAADPANSVLVIDSRTPDWVSNGTIPGAVNIPWTRLSPSAGADPFDIAEIFEQRFGAIAQEGFWNFSNARTLVLFCNGNWCGQSPTNIRTLLHFGYPAHRIKWYRGGMQAWESLGLTVVR